ncbi:hypothetical protein K2173_017839 [Erythroxylum novogranatense]|uniref:NEDD8 ultimate buster 1 n=1 Tax=Erythroxylum novogranatense TaxID=1862640 RepID=A0AAV8SLT2_9ROSI|nr:hypothetical protein K2173_017839 [Erythroxylum novogranatense]
MGKLRIAWTWKGVLEVDLDKWDVSMLREEVGRRSNMSPELINLIFAGRILRDSDVSEKLVQLGIRNNSRILAGGIAIDEGEALREELMASEARSCRYARLREAATALSKRHAHGSLPVENFDIELEDQSGQKVHFSETDRQGIMMALMLHANGKRLIRKQMFKDALEVLTMAEEAFSLCNPKAIELIDNVPILQIDMVWCYFMLQDVAWLSVAGIRLEKAREGLERAHGKDAERFRLLQAGQSSGLALYLRLELLEGVVAYHNHQFDKSRRFLVSAQTKFLQLQVSDEALSLVMSMGFKEQDAKRALRMCNQVVERAVEFCLEEKAKRAQKHEDDIRRKNEIKEQKQYGVTPLKKAVDLQRLQELVSIGFEKELAAEALRRNENDTQKALDDLTNPEANTIIQRDIETRKRKRQQQAADKKIEQLVAMGFERSRVVEAVRAGGSLQQIMNQLLTQPEANPPVADNNSISIPDTLSTDSAAEGIDSNDLVNDELVGGSSGSRTEQRDVEMEDEIADEIATADAFSDYDIEVTREGEAIAEYLSLLDSAGDKGMEASSSK